MPRVFTAIDVPDGIRTELVQGQRELDRGFNPVDPAQFHVTLQFFADIDEDEIERVKRAMGDVAIDPFPATVQGVGAFPSLDYISVVWAGVEGDEIYRLQEQAAAHDVPADDSHDFHPHITLLRVDAPSPGQKRQLHERIEALADTPFGSFTVDHVTLYESQLHADRSEYVELHRANL